MNVPYPASVLMKPGHRIPVYLWSDLNEAVGMIPHPLNNVLNRNAVALGWRPRKHSDFAVGEENDANEEMWFPIIWEWYYQILRPAITVEEE